jgi:hypothetical protein
MQAFDASAMMHAWDNYPIDQFPALWTWIASEIAAQRIAMAVVALEEVAHKLPECVTWLREQHVARLSMTAAVLTEAMRIKGLLGINDDRYSPKGVDENDLLIVASAKLNGRELICNEGRQLALPQLMPNCKIPAVCGLPTVNVSCLDFVSYMKRSRAVFQ